MKILQVTRMNGEMVAIVDKGNPVPIKSIKGNPRVGATLNEDYKVTVNNVDENCVNGVCDWSTDERLDSK